MQHTKSDMRICSEKEDDLEKRYELLNRELRQAMTTEGQYEHMYFCEGEFCLCILFWTVYLFLDLKICCFITTVTVIKRSSRL